MRRCDRSEKGNEPIFQHCYLLNEYLLSNNNNTDESDKSRKVTKPKKETNCQQHCQKSKIFNSLRKRISIPLTNIKCFFPVSGDDIDPIIFVVTLKTQMSPTRKARNLISIGLTRNFIVAGSFLRIWRRMQTNWKEISFIYSNDQQFIAKKTNKLCNTINAEN